jgi:hypothetical protein
MYKRISLTICLVTLLSQFGCGSDAPSTMVMDPAMIGPAAGTGPASPAGTGKACEQITVDPSFAKNLCNNPHDKCLETTNTAKVRSISGMCATGKMLGPSGDNCAKYVGDPSGPEAVKCFSDCVKPATTSTLGDTLSDACWSCPDEVVVCGAKYCVLQCINDSLSPACTECLCAQHPDAVAPGKAGNCLQDVFAQCTGYRPTAEAVGCPAPGTGAAGMTATGAAGRAVAGASGGTAAGAGAAGMSTAGMMSIAGTGGAGGMGASGMSAAGGPAAGSGGTNPTDTFKRPCLKMGNEVVFIGDSYSKYGVAHTDLSVLIAQLARKDGALPATQSYRDLAQAGTTLAAPGIMIPPQWDSAKRTKPIKAVIMDGGGNDVLIANMQCLADGSEKNPGCQSVVKDSMTEAKVLLDDMKATGVSDVVWFWYPHLPGGNGTAISDYTYPMLVDLAKSVSTDMFHVFMVDTVSIFEGHPEYFFTDGIHANDTGEGKIAEAVWKVMKDNCIAQAATNMCCMP